MNLKVFSSILAVLIIASVLLVYFSFINKPQETKPIKDANDLSSSYYELKQKDFINVLYDFSYTISNNTSYYLYMKDKNKFEFIQFTCNQSLDARSLSISEIGEDEFLFAVHAYPYFYSYENKYLERPQIIDYSNLFLSFGCFNTTSSKSNETIRNIVCFNQPSGIITKFDTKFNSSNLNYNMSRNLVYASFKEEKPEDIIKNNNPCK